MEFGTHIGKVVDEDDFLDKVGRRSIQNGVYSTQEDWPSFVVEADDNVRGRQRRQVSIGLFTPAIPPFKNTYYVDKSKDISINSSWVIGVQHLSGKYFSL